MYTKCKLNIIVNKLYYLIIFLFYIILLCSKHNKKYPPIDFKNILNLKYEIIKSNHIVPRWGILRPHNSKMNFPYKKRSVVVFLF